MNEAKKITIAVITAIAILGAGYGGYVSYKSYKEKKEEEALAAILAVKQRNYNDLSTMKDIGGRVSSILDNIYYSFGSDTAFSIFIDEVRMKKESQESYDAVKQLEIEQTKLNKINNGNLDASKVELNNYINNSINQFKGIRDIIMRGNIFETSEVASKIKNVEETNGKLFEKDVSAEMNKYKN